MFLHVPCENADTLEVHIGIMAGPAFTDDVPIDLACYRILNAIDNLHRSIRIFFAVLRNVAWDIKLDSTR